MGYINFLARILNDTGVFLISLGVGALFYSLYFFNSSFKGQRRLLNMLPGIFTSLGLLGTFVAIVYSLHDVSQETLEVTEIIHQLVPAFTSSIAGLIMALTGTIIAKCVFSIEDRKFEKEVKGITPEETIIEIQNDLVTINNNLSEQSEMSKVYNDRLTSTISQQSAILEKFINDFVARMDDIFTKMHGKIEEQIQSFGEDQFRKSSVVLQDINQKFVDITSSLQTTQKENVEAMFKNTGAEMSRILETFQTSMNGLSNNLSKALTALGDSQQEKIGDIVNKYNDLSSQMTSQMQNGVNSMQELNTKNINAINDLNNKFNESSSKLLSDASQMNQNLIQSVKEMNEKNLSSFTTLNEQIIKSNTTLMEDTEQMNKNVVNAIQDNLSQTAKTITEQISSQAQILENSIATTVEELRKNYEFISDHVAELVGNYESAVIAYEDSLKNVHRLNESRENALKNFEDGLKSVERTNENVNKGITILQQRDESIEKLIMSIKEVSTTIECLQKLELQLNKIASRCEN